MTDVFISQLRLKVPDLTAQEGAALKAAEPAIHKALKVLKHKCCVSNWAIQYAIALFAPSKYPHIWKDEDIDRLLSACQDFVYKARGHGLVGTYPHTLVQQDGLSYFVRDPEVVSWALPLEQRGRCADELFMRTIIQTCLSPDWWDDPCDEIDEEFIRFTDSKPIPSRKGDPVPQNYALTEGWMADDEKMATIIANRTLNWDDWDSDGAGFFPPTVASVLKWRKSSNGGLRASIKESDLQSLAKLRTDVTPKVLGKIIRCLNKKAIKLFVLAVKAGRAIVDSKARRLDTLAVKSAVYILIKQEVPPEKLLSKWLAVPNFPT